MKLEVKLKIYVVNWVYLQELLKLTGTFAGLEVNEAKRLRELESESNKLKRLLAEKILDKINQDTHSKRLI
tara:strand:- start:486 stop:698 length:213 start_codon:yes stop_codon:yes gene_type:complete